MPYPVISGFMTGIGAIIILLQINPLFGHIAFGNIITTIKSYPETFTNVDYHCAFLGLLTLLIVFLRLKNIKYCTVFIIGIDNCDFDIFQRSF